MDVIEDFVTYEQAMTLKNLGFKDKCFYFYNTHKELTPNSICDEFENVNDALDSANSSNIVKGACDAPFLYQVQKWLGNEKKLSISILLDCDEVIIGYTYFITDLKIKGCVAMHGMFDSYEDALSKSITECLKILEEL